MAVAVGGKRTGRGDVLLERDEELKLLRRGLARLRRGEGGVVLISGPAGIGKSALLRAAVDDARGARVLQASGSPLEHDFPYGIAVQLLERTAAGADLQLRERLLEGPAALAGPLLWAGEPARHGPPVAGGWVDPEPGLRHGLYWLMANLAEVQPVLAVVDDLQWADVQSRGWLAYLARRARDSALLLCLAIRTGDQGSAGADIDALHAAADHVVNPEPLSLEAAAALARDMVAGEGGAELAAACHRVTGGNPLYLGEVMRSVAAGKLSLAGLHSGRLAAPARLREMVRSRMGGMGEAARALARALAVLDHAELRSARRLAGLHGDAASRAAAELIGAELIADEPALRFVHPVIGAAVYESIAAPERGRLHSRAATLLAQDGAPTDAIAAHLLVSNPAGDPQTADWLLAAGRQALEHGAPGAAVSYLRRALQEPPPKTAVPEVLVALADAEAHVHDAAAVGHYQEALDLSAGPSERLRVSMRLGRALAQQGRLQEAEERYQAAAAQAQVTDRRLALEAEASALLMSVLRQGGGLAGQTRIKTLAAHATGATSGERAVLAHLAYHGAMRNRPAAEVRALAERALADGHLLEVDTADAPWFFMAVNALCFADALALADQQLDAGIADCVARGSLLGYPIASAFRARVAYRQGRITEALASASDALGVEELGPSDVWKPVAIAFLADAHQERGELERASQLIEAMTVDRRLGESVVWNLVLESRGRLRLVQARYEEALADLLACGELQEQWGGANPALIPWRSAAAIAAAHTGDHQLAARLLKTELQRARRFGAPRALGIALRADGITRALDGRHQQAVVKLRASVEALAGTEARLEHARALVDLGAAVRRGGQSARARDPLRAGLDRAMRCGATALAEQAREELIATGARPRRDYSTGAAALTPSELRIGQLAADGLTNRQIASRLFLTTKTIEMHLANAYRKLDISSRRQLAGALESQI